MKKMITRKTTKKGLSIILTMFMFFGMANMSLYAFATNVAEINATNFPDANWRTFVSTNYDTNSDGYLSDTEIAAVSSINVSASSIADLKGVEYFTNLETLRCYDNNLTALDVTSNTKLKDLRFQNNQITSIDLSHNPDLYRLYAYNNALTALNVNTNEDLLYLYCYGNQIASLDVSNNLLLQIVHCYGNQLSTFDVTGKSSITNINTGTQAPTLNLQYASGQYYVALSGPNYDASRITNLSAGTADSRGITFGAFSNVPATVTYNYNTAWSGGTNTISVTATINKGAAINDTNFPDSNWRNYVATKDTDGNGYLSVDEANAVTSISVYNSSIANLTGIEYFTKATYLNCSNNQLTSLNVSKNTELTELNCDNNRLVTLDISHNIKLVYFYCSYNQLTSIDVSHNTLLIAWTCNNNQLTSLDISNNLAVGGMDCSYNQLTSLNLNNALIALICDHNQLTSLDLSNNKKLDGVICTNNQLTSLNISGCSVLTGIDCSNNQLTSLIVSSNTALETLGCHNNQLTELNLSQNVALKELACFGNHLTELDVSNCATFTAYIADTQNVQKSITYMNGKYYVELQGNYVQGNYYTGARVTYTSEGTADDIGIYFDTLQEVPDSLIYIFDAGQGKTMSVNVTIS